MGRNLFTGAQRAVKTLLIMRHAKSDWFTAGADFDRPLNKRGRRDVPQLARLLGGLEEKPRLILSSPAASATRHLATSPSPTSCTRTTA